MHLQNPKMITTANNHQSRGTSLPHHHQTTSATKKMATLQATELQQMDKNMSTLSGGN